MVSPFYHPPHLLCSPASLPPPPFPVHQLQPVSLLTGSHRYPSCSQPHPPRCPTEQQGRLSPWPWDHCCTELLQCSAPHHGIRVGPVLGRSLHHWPSLQSPHDPWHVAGTAEALILGPNRHRCPEELQQFLEEPGLREVSQLSSRSKQTSTKANSSLVESLISLALAAPHKARRCPCSPEGERRNTRCSGPAHTLHT